LNSAPGSFATVKTMVVLSATGVLQRTAADDDEAGDVVVVVLHRRGERHKPEDFARARRGDRRGITRAGIGDHLRAASRVVGRDDLDAFQRAQKALALGQSLRMRVDALEASSVTPGSASRWCTTGSSTSPTIGSSCDSSRS